MKIQPNSKLVMIGDSITDCGRARPIAEAWGDALGNGYVNLLNAFFSATMPEARLRIINVGTSGNTVLDLATRWQTDVIDLKPDWLSIFIGINDVWRQFDSALQPEKHVPLDVYANTLEKLIQNTRSHLRGLVLMTPFFIEPNRNDPMRARMDQYGDVVRQLAPRYEAVLVDTQAAFDDALNTLHPMALAWDRVHPSTPGHMILARAFLKAVDYVW